MFLQNGFDGYITKPVDSNELNLVLNDFILNKKPREVVEAARKEQREIKLKENTLEQNLAKKSDVEKFISMDAKKAINILEDLYTRIHNLDEDGIDQFNVTVHEMKSALANIGEKELSGIARKLEKAGINLNFDYLYAETPVLISGLKSLIAKLKQGEHVR
jgi:HPt (histidine-containing phosphotransfer) domain-containing protein